MDKSLIFLIASLLICVGIIIGGTVTNIINNTYATTDLNRDGQSDLTDVSIALYVINTLTTNENNTQPSDVRDVR